LAIVVSAVAYPSLPERVPMHWDLDGNVDRLGSRFEAAMLLPIVGIVLWLAMRALPRIDPRRENYAKFQGSYDLVINAVVTLLMVLHVAVIGVALGFPIPLTRVMIASAGAMLVVLGNVLPRARPNWWFGIRTPWTLSNDRVWTRTHRVGGYLLVIAGIACVVAALFVSERTTPVVFFSTLIAAAVGSAGYSYFVWRQETSR
jgi:uncharacterized membrane protein